MKKLNSTLLKNMAFISLCAASTFSFASDKNLNKNGIPFYLFTPQSQTMSSEPTKPMPSTNVIEGNAMPSSSTGANAGPGMGAGMGMMHGMGWMRQSYTPELRLADPEVVSDSIEKIRKVICNEAGEAEAKLWLMFDKDGKVGIGAPNSGSPVSSVEMTIHCKG